MSSPFPLDLDGVAVVEPELFHELGGEPRDPAAAVARRQVRHLDAPHLRPLRHFRVRHRLSFMPPRFAIETARSLWSSIWAPLAPLKAPYFKT